MVVISCLDLQKLFLVMTFTIDMMYKASVKTLPLLDPGGCVTGMRVLLILHSSAIRYLIPGMFESLPAFLEVQTNDQIQCFSD